MDEKSSYRWWREHGASWDVEYDRRKKDQVCYHLQEAMLAAYAAHSAPLKVLEYGCGVGRHLRYLDAIEGVEVYGVDQSGSMLQGLRAWASPEWMRARTARIEPQARLPYETKSFDLVFTTEVLVHTHQDDLPGILSEILRVARWQVLHLETAPGYKLHENAHGGSWYHDLQTAYAALGHECERLPQGYTMHAPWRVVLDERRPLYTWPDALLDLFRRAEVDLQASLDQRGQRIEQLERALDKANEHIEAQEQKLRIHQAKLKNLNREIRYHSQQLEAAEEFEQALARALRLLDR